MAAFSIVLGAFMTAILGYCALLVPRWITLAGGISIAILAQIAAGDPIFTAMAVMLIFGLLVGQIMVPLVLDFGSTIARLPQERRAAILGRSVKLGLPILVLGTLSIWGSLKLDDWLADRTVYAIPSENPDLACGAEDAPRLVCEGEAGIEQDVAEALARVFDVVEANLRRDIREAVEASDAAGAEGGAAIKAAIDSNISEKIGSVAPSLDYRNYPCKWYHWFVAPLRCVKREFLKPLDRAYTSATRAIKADLNRSVDTALARGALSGEALVATADRVVVEELNGIERRVLTANRTTFLALRTVSALSIALTVLAMAKALIVIYARFAYDPNEGGLAITYPGRRPQRPGTVAFEDLTRHDDGKGYGFEQPILGRTWHLSYGRGLRPERRGYLRLCRPLAFTLPRLATGSLLMASYPPNFPTGTFGAYGPRDRCFARINLEPGARVAVRLSALLGFCDEVKMRTIFDVRLATLLQVGFLLRVFEGPGTVLLTADGGSVVKMSPGGTSADPYDVIAFDLDGEFHLDVQHGMGSVYADGYSLLPSGGTVAVRTTAHTARRTAGQLLRKLAFFILPI